jgi:hypothetical protein
MNLFVHSDMKIVVALSMKWPFHQRWDYEAPFVGWDWKAKMPMVRQRGRWDRA